jgi:hypothetical protein
MPLDRPAYGIDALLLATALELELSPRDQRVKHKRYQVLAERLNRPSSPIAPYLTDGASLIYPQGSVAIGATIVSGDSDDRFDVDAVVEFLVPSHWPLSRALDLLEDALEGFPDSVEIVRCTRCIQVRFPFMHLDVTPLDSHRGNRLARAGDVFHVPDQGSAKRCPSNPYGFAEWVKGKMRAQPPAAAYLSAVSEARARFTPRDRLYAGADIIARAEQEPLPVDDPAIGDTPQIIVLKLVKRFLNLRFARPGLAGRKRPPSIYLTKIAVQQAYNPQGLCAQLEAYTDDLRERVSTALATGVRPYETNPALPAEEITDRWPKDATDLELLKTDLDFLQRKLSLARQGSISEIRDLFGEMFGETVSGRAAAAYFDAAKQNPRTRIEHGQGFLAAPSAALATSAGAAPRTSSVRPHSFHPGILTRR